MSIDRTSHVTGHLSPIYKPLSIPVPTSQSTPSNKGADTPVSDGPINSGLGAQTIAKQAVVFDFPTELLAKYTPAELLGSGGMGKVIGVTQNYTSRRLAIKLAPITLTPNLIARWEAEVKAHRDASCSPLGLETYVVRYHESGITDNGQRYIVMDRAKESLKDFINSGRNTNVSQTVSYLAQIARGLDEILERSHIPAHRDIKPGNVLIGEDNIARVADFGLVTTNNTETGDINGTPGYLAPEFIHGTKDSNKFSDMFSFGVLAYEALTGTNPFQADSPVRAFLKTQNFEPEHLSNINAEVPQEVGDIISALLQKDPKDRVRPDSLNPAPGVKARYLTFREIADDLCHAAGIPSPASNALLRRRELVAKLQQAEMSIAHPLPSS